MSVCVYMRVCECMSVCSVVRWTGLVSALLVCCVRGRVCVCERVSECECVCMSV